MSHQPLRGFVEETFMKYQEKLKYDDKNIKIYLKWRLKSAYYFCGVIALFSIKHNSKLFYANILNIYIKNKLIIILNGAEENIICDVAFLFIYSFCKCLFYQKN